MEPILYRKNKNWKTYLQYQGFKALNEIKFQESPIDQAAKDIFSFQTV